FFAGTPSGALAAFASLASFWAAAAFVGPEVLRVLAGFFGAGSVVASAWFADSAVESVSSAPAAVPASLAGSLGASVAALRERARPRTEEARFRLPRCAITLGLPSPNSSQTLDRTGADRVRCTRPPGVNTVVHL